MNRSSRVIRLSAATIVLVGLGTQSVSSSADESQTLDEELLEALSGGGHAEESPASIVPRLIDSTRAAARRLKSGQVDEETENLQKQILADLDALLEQAPQSPPPPSSSSQESASQQDRLPEDSAAEKQQQQSSSQSEGERQADPNAAASESEERTTPGSSVAGEREQRLGLSTAAWGHLPPKVREQMRSAFSEEFLPEYDSLVRRYYEALARRSR